MLSRCYEPHENHDPRGWRTKIDSHVEILELSTLTYPSKDHAHTGRTNARRNHESSDTKLDFDKCKF